MNTISEKQQHTRILAAFHSWSCFQKRGAYKCKCRNYVSLFVSLHHYGYIWQTVHTLSLIWIYVMCLWWLTHFKFGSMASFRKKNWFIHPVHHQRQKQPRKPPKCQHIIAILNESIFLYINNTNKKKQVIHIDPHFKVLNNDPQFKHSINKTSFNIPITTCTPSLVLSLTQST